ncbi:MAG: bifunctional diaminohydroxyphosphoribosylaminopyrimidine deaminase/5-amino-6-(5-phosphoribosylamino)uracil reductase RibD [Deltaproteobacteria bacterium]|nr:bifunctional diaminohydroxyphosphoribosylaminopyrimidine deaminase/5-amino-6-(5-phosphoribosylamino)uracil reductase RibD [Deltaproteobacteria bacterium]
MNYQSKDIDEYFIAQTFNLAKKAEGFTSPNPMVGAIVVKDGLAVGDGYHEKAGLPHAEIAALKKAGSRAKGATIYVSLEPCSHFGKTPPCIYAIKKYGIKRVVAAVKDPNPSVSGKGFDYLQNNGIEVTYGIFEGKAKRLNEVFFKYITSGLPFITVKEAITLDGKIGRRNIRKKSYISSKKSLEHTHYLRLTNDAIMVSAKTVINDDPMLDVRINNRDIKNKFLNKRYTKIILDRDLSVPPGAKIFKTYGTVLIFTDKDYNNEKSKKKLLLEETGAIIRDVYYNNKDKRLLDLKEIFKICAELKITSILAEAGPNLFNSLIGGGFYDKLIFNITPYIFGNEDGVNLFETLDLKNKNMLKFYDLNAKKIGDEIFLTYYPKD